MVLEKYANALERAIQAQNRSPVGYGSEFRPKEQSVKLFGLHPCWSRMESILTQSSFWPLDDLNEEHRKQDLEQALAFGNHEDNKNHLSQLLKLVEKDIIHEDGLHFPSNKTQTSPSVIFAPMNIALTQARLWRRSNLPMTRVLNGVPVVQSIKE